VAYLCKLQDVCGPLTPDRQLPIIFNSKLANTCNTMRFTIKQGFDLEFDFGTEISEFTPSQLAAFDQVEAAFESQIVGYQPGVTLSGSVVSVNAGIIDGPINFDTGTGTTIGTGGGSYIPGALNGGFQFFAPVTDPSFTGTDGLVSSGTGTFATGVVNLDEDDIATVEGFGSGSDNGLFNIIFHEVAHALGFGVLWEANGLVDSNGQYTGANGLEAFQNEFDASATFVPTDGISPATAQHWSETSLLGSDRLSPVLTLGASNPVSDTTFASFEDLGFVTAASVTNITDVTAVPEPSSLILLASSGLLLLLGRRRSA